ncbi:PREDICTED: cornifin alpha-like [Chlamydotis macqueenii]|uniref:cornifin alpha-like n=1 Tax=Chlamydotis macqueenii TaxID=187382 RepID=UPI00052A0449|nr:PREDICTED: cornifin alpha-like [Chlamydotis macqueenii]
MAYYGYQYKQQCYIPGGAMCATPAFPQCHNPNVVKCVSHTPCAVRKMTQSSPKCSMPCSSQCVETHTMEGHCSPCSPRSPDPCTTAFPQPHVQGREHLCVPHCGQPTFTRFPQVHAPAHMYQHSSYPYSYQWSNSYHYKCGQQ